MLRTAIAAIRRKNDRRKSDLDLARIKTTELQRMISELQSKNNTIEQEKQDISAVLDKVNGQVRDLEGNVQRLDQQNKVLTEKINLASALIASELSLMPVTVKNDKEQETNLAKKTIKLVVSFAVQNNVTDYETTDIFIVVTEPDGKIMRNEDLWENTTITLQNGSRINFTRRIKFEYKKGEAKRLIFSLTPDEYLKGVYAVQLYHNGMLIGQTMKALK